MAITVDDIKKLKELTGIGLTDAKAALVEANGDFDKALEQLRKKGLTKAEKKGDRETREGIIDSYVHSDRIGVIVEVNCETDFVARGDEFLALAKEIAMHVAWANPRFVRREEVTEDALEREKDVYLTQIKPEQAAMKDKIIAGKLEKFYEGVCLLEQFDAKDPTSKKRIGDLLSDLSAKVGEKIVLRRFLRYEVGEGIEKAQTDFAEEVRQAANV